MGYGIEKSVVLLVSPDLPHQKDGVKHDAGDDDGEKNDPKYHENDLTDIEDHPTYVERDGDSD
jgi:hypothetical protein